MRMALFAVVEQRVTIRKNVLIGLRRNRSPNRIRRSCHYGGQAVGNDSAIDDHIGDFLSASALAIPAPGISSIFRFIRSSAN
jgi:hypothetical protein